MTPGQSYQFRQGFNSGKSTQTAPVLNTISGSGSRYHQHRVPTGPNNPCISISFEDYNVTDDNFDVLLELIRNFGIERLSGESKKGWRIFFPDSIEGQRLAEDCYRFLNGRRLSHQILRLRKFDSGSPTKNLWSPLNTHHWRKPTSPQRQQPNYGHSRRISGQQLTAPPRGEYPSESTARKLPHSGTDLHKSPKTKPLTESSLASSAYQSPSSRPGTATETPLHGTVGNVRTLITDSHISTRSSENISTVLSDHQTTESFSAVPTHLSLQPFRAIERRRMSIGSDEMSISSGPAVSDIPSTPSVTAIPRCCTCKKPDTTDHNPLIRCACRRSYHAACHKPVIPLNLQSQIAWLCAVCTKKGRIIPGDIDVPRSAPVAGVQRVPPWRVNGFVAETPPDRTPSLTKAVPLSSEPHEQQSENRWRPKAHSHRVPATVFNRTAPQTSRDILAATPEAQESATRVIPSRIDRESPKVSGVRVAPYAPSPARSVGVSTWQEDKYLLNPSSLMKEPNGQKPDADRLLSNHSSASSQVQNRNTYQTQSPSTNNCTATTRQRMPVQTTPAKLLDDDAQQVTSKANSDTSSSESFAAQDRQSSTTSYEQVADTPEMVGLQTDQKAPGLSGNFMSDSDSDLSSVPEEVSSEVVSELQRPSVSFNRMITAAISESVLGQLDGKEVIAWIRDHYPFYADAFSQKTLYSNVHALLSMGKNEGRFIKHEPPPGVRTRCKYSLSQKGQQKLERKRSTTEKPQQQHQHQLLRPNSLLTPQASTSANSTPAPRSRTDDPDDEDMPRTAGDVGYCVRNRTTSKYRIAPKNGMPEWETLPLLRDVEHDEMKLSEGDMVKVLLENTNDDYGKIFEMRRVSEDIIAVAILWYISTEDIQKIISHRNRREWPEGYKYLLTNWVDVINLKAIECKADPVELQNVFKGSKVVDCSGGTRLIRETTAKEVAWVMKLAPTDFGMTIRKETTKSDTTPLAPPQSLASAPLHVYSSKNNSSSTKIPTKRKRDHSNSFTDIKITERNVKDTTTDPIGEDTLNSRKESSPPRKFKKRKLSNTSHADKPFDELEVVRTENEVGSRMLLVGTKNGASKPVIQNYVKHGGLDQAIDAGIPSLELSTILAAKDAEIARLNSIVHSMRNGKDSKFDKLLVQAHTCKQVPHEMMLKAHSLRSGRSSHQFSDTAHTEPTLDAPRCIPPIALNSELQALRVESNQRFRVLTDLKSLVDARSNGILTDLKVAAVKQTNGIQQLKHSLNGGDHDRAVPRVDPGQWLFGRNAMARGLLYDQKISDWRSTSEIETQRRSATPIAPHTPYLKSQKKRFFGKLLPRREGELTKYGETPCPELQKMLGIPDRHVLCSHQGVLSYRDDTRAADGSLLNPLAIYPLDYASKDSKAGSGSNGKKRA